MSQSKCKQIILILIVSFFWIFCVYKSTLGMRGHGNENLFLTNTYSWLFYSILAIISFGVFVVLARNFPSKFITIVGGIVCGITLILQVASPIGASTDYYRYLWQGRLSNTGKANYALVPWDAGVEKANNELFYRMDWRDVKSVYPPLAEQYFRIPASIFDAGIIKNTSFQTKLSLSKIPNLLLFIISAFLLYKITKRKLVGVLWLAFPLMQFELVNSAHVDILSITLFIGALCALKSNNLLEHILAGSLIAAAGMVKLVPFVLILPTVAYLYVNYSLKRAVLAFSAFLIVIATTIQPFIYNDFALTKRIRFWLSGAEFSQGNPLYEKFSLIPGGLGAGFLKVLALSAGFVVVFSIVRSVAHKKLTYTTMLKYGLLLLLIPFISSPIVLPWYWLTPLAVLFVYRFLENAPLRSTELFVLIVATILILVQYVDRAVDTSVNTRQSITFVANLVFYGLILLLVRALYINSPTGSKT